MLSKEIKHKFWEVRERLLEFGAPDEFIEHAEVMADVADGLKTALESWEKGSNRIGANEVLNTILGPTLYEAWWETKGREMTYDKEG